MQLHNQYTRRGSIPLSFHWLAESYERQSEIFLSCNEIIAILWIDPDFVESDNAVNLMFEDKYRVSENINFKQKCKAIILNYEKHRQKRSI